MKFAVLGSPIAHSMSPAMHRAAYRALGLSHTYEAIDVDAAHFPDFLKSLRQENFAGFSVTVPHKLRAFELADEAAPSAQSARAANMLARESSGKIVAHNTDAPALAFELACLAGDRDWSATRALVIGSGGAARAAALAFANLGVKKIVALARSIDRAKSLEAIAPIEKFSSFENPPLFEFDAVVQATSAGMDGADDGEIVASCIDWSRVPANAIAIDVVYSPRDTPFLRAARAAKIPCENGLGMLVRQGAIAFELWLGVAAPLDAMRRALGV